MVSLEEEFNKLVGNQVDEDQADERTEDDLQDENEITEESELTDDEGRSEEGGRDQEGESGQGDEGPLHEQQLEESSSSDEEFDESQYEGAPKDLIAAARRNFEKQKQSRQEIEEYKRKIEEQSNLVSQLIAKMSANQQEQQPKEPEPEQLPDKELYPEDYAVAVAERSQARSEQLERQLLEERTITQLRSVLATSEQVTDIPDYKEAREHADKVMEMIIDSRGGQGLTKAQRAQAKQDILDGVVADAVQAGIDPAKYIYDQCRIHGYVPRQQKEAGPDLQAINRNSRKSKGIGAAAGGRGKSKTIGLAELNAMKPKELNEFMQNPENKDIIEQILVENV